MDKDTGQVEILAGMDDASIYQTSGRVFAYHTHPDTQKLIVAINARRTEEQFPTVELLSINLITEQLTFLYSYTGVFWSASSEGLVSTIKLSQDGQWVAFLIEDVVPFEDDYTNTYSLNILAVDGTRLPLEIASCTTIPPKNFYCNEGSIVWSNSNRMLAWRSYDGLWTYTRGAEPQLVIKHVRIPDEEFRNKTYSPIAFSPDDRYLMINMAGWEGGLQGVLDTVTGKTGVMPDTGYSVGDDPLSSAIWLNDGRVLVMRSHDHFDESQVNAILRTYRPDPENELLLQKDFLFNIPLELGNNPYYPFEVREGIYLFGLISFDALTDEYPYVERDAFYYLFDEATQELTQIGQYRTDGPGGQCFGNAYFCGWVPDGSGRLLFQGEWLGDSEYVVHRYYLKLDGSELIELNPFLGEEPCCFSWKP
ncbi:MAG: hypothetical protein HND51_09645 [Chloroflexi bacterium]|nr:hypothetical protein [Chloroflexota bacterium]